MLRGKRIVLNTEDIVGTKLGGMGGKSWQASARARASGKSKCKRQTLLEGRRAARSLVNR